MTDTTEAKYGGWCTDDDTLVKEIRERFPKMPDEVLSDIIMELAAEFYYEDAIHAVRSGWIGLTMLH